MKTGSTNFENEGHKLEDGESSHVVDTSVFNESTISESAQQKDHGDTKKKTDSDSAAFSANKESRPN